MPTPRAILYIDLCIARHHATPYTADSIVEKRLRISSDRSQASRVSRKAMHVPSLPWELSVFFGLFILSQNFTYTLSSVLTSNSATMIIVKATKYCLETQAVVWLYLVNCVKILRLWNHKHYVIESIRCVICTMKYRQGIFTVRCADLARNSVCPSVRLSGECMH